MARKLFGTDGVRGLAGEFLTAELALALGRAATEQTGAERPQVLIVRDTRESGEMLEAALAARDDIPIDVVIHDELDLPFGVIRCKTGGGDNGHLMAPRVPRLGEAVAEQHHGTGALFSQMNTNAVGVNRA